MLPAEPTVLLARQAFPDAQAAMFGALGPAGVYTVGWYGSTVNDERGSFAVVNALGPLADLVGDFVNVSYEGRDVNVYVIGAQASLPDDLDMTRRAFMQIGFLAREPISAAVAVIT